MEYGSSEKRLPSFSQAFQTAFSNVESVNASIGFKTKDAPANYTGMEGIPTAIDEIPSSTIPVLDTHLMIEQFPTSHMNLAEMDTNNSNQANTEEISTKFTDVNAENFCASTNIPGPERIPTAIVEIPSITIPVQDTHLMIEQFPTSHVNLAEMDTNNSYRENTEEISTKFTHVNAENFFLLKTNQTGELSTSFNVTNSSKIPLQNSQTDDFNNILPMRIHQSNASERHTNTSQEIKMSTKNIANALDICSKYTAYARSLKIALQKSQSDAYNIRFTTTYKTNTSIGRTNASQQIKTLPKMISDALAIHSKSTAQASSSKICLQNSQTDACNMRSTNAHKSNASAERTNTNQQLKTSPEIIPDALEIHSKSTAQTTTSKIVLQNSQTDVCKTLSMNTPHLRKQLKSKVFETESVTRSKNANKIPIKPGLFPKVYLCNACDWKFHWINFLVSKDFPADSGYKCKLCSSYFVARGELNVHLRCSHLVVSIPNCELCNENSTSRTMRDYAPEFFTSTFRIRRSFQNASLC